MVSVLSQTSLSQISMHIQIFIPVKASFFWKGFQQSIQQFDYCNKTSKEVNQRKSLLGSNYWEPDRYSEFFLKNLWKILVKEFIFDNVAGCRPIVLLKKEFFLRHFSRILPQDLVCKVIEQVFWRKPIQLKQFHWLLLLMPTIS